jgi:hypothetical protein
MNERPPIPDNVRRFVLANVGSVPFLEAALLLRGEPTVSWDAQRLSERLYVSKRRAAELLDQLEETGFTQPGIKKRTWVWGPQEPLVSVIEELSAVYARDLVGVTQLIHSRSDSRARQFADAFRWRKED